VKILIVDDEPLARERIRELLKRERDVASVSEAANGGEALEKIYNDRPDVLFLDIQMPDMTGFDVLASLDKKFLGQIPAIVFVTAYDEFALRAFDFHALDYLLKPFDRKRFTDTLRIARERIAHSQGNGSDTRLRSLLEELTAKPSYLEWLTIRKDERILLIRTSDIQWIEAHGNYALLKLDRASHLMRETMDRLESQLDPRVFLRIHRSTIVNVNQIKELQAWARGEYRVVTFAGPAFTLSRGYRARFDEFLKGRTI
jgi:two-component system LytT family response regulator